MTITPASDQHDQRVRVGIVPGAARALRPRLLDALEALYPVRFVPRDAAQLGDLDALVCLGEDALAVADSAPAGLPCLAALGGERLAPELRPVDLADDTALDRPLRGARLHDGATDALPAHCADGKVLATIAGAPCWIVRADGTQVVAAAPDELGADELLRERLVPGRCLALLALTHFLREQTAVRDWRPPPLRAAFVLDDPNLHWPTYGHLRYRELLTHAAEHRYHLAVAMVPLDAWLVHPGVARMFRDGSDRLSILVHGNDHDGGELGRVASDADGVQLAAQALRRIERFERRSGLRVARVMAPPHERVTEPSLRGLLACGFEAVSTARPFPWLQADGSSWLIHPSGVEPSAVSTPAHETSDGLPVLLRLDFGHPREELVLRAYLGQPLIVYGHHGDLADGLDVLAEAAEQINRLGDVRWLALDEIARAGAQTRVEGTTLHVRPHARRLSIEIPAGVELLRVEPRDASEAEVVAAVRGPGTYELERARTSADLPTGHRTRLRPLARRIATEGRDRLRAVL
ncbi:MAG: hypothetical protein V7607_4249 [Solirubrobacteraceae bacterium]